MNLICGENLIFSNTINSNIISYSIVAPLVFKKLGSRIYSGSSKSIISKVFALISVLALINWILAWLSNSPCIAGTLHAISFILALKAFLLIKPTNQATDDGNTKKFKLLHKIMFYLHWSF